MTAQIISTQWHMLSLGNKQEFPSKLPAIMAAYLECRTAKVIPSEASILLGEDPLTKLTNLYFPPESTPIAWKLGAVKCEKPDMALADIITDAPDL